VNKISVKFEGVQDAKCSANTLIEAPVLVKREVEYHKEIVCFSLCNTIFVCTCYDVLENAL
jgi:hypothetical protein